MFQIYRVFTSFLHMVLTSGSLCFFCLEHCFSPHSASFVWLTLCNKQGIARYCKRKIQNFQRLNTARVYFSFASESSDGISHWETFFTSILEPRLLLSPWVPCPLGPWRISPLVEQGERENEGSLNQAWMSTVSLTYTHLSHIVTLNYDREWRL